MTKKTGRADMKNCVAYIKSFVFLFVFLTVVALHAYAEQLIENKISYSYNDENIRLEIIEYEPYLHGVVLNGMLIHKDQSSYTLLVKNFLAGWGVKSENIFLLEENSGGSGSGATRRLIAIRPKEGIYMSDSFGNGAVPKISEDSLAGRISFEFPQLRQRASSVTYVYENGKVIKLK